MPATFMHVGKFKVKPESRADFIGLMKRYEMSAQQNGLDHSHLIEDEKEAGTFMHVTVWGKRDDWVAVEESPAHKDMHDKRDHMLAAPMEHDFICGTIEL